LVTEFTPCNDELPAPYGSCLDEDDGDCPETIRGALDPDAFRAVDHLVGIDHAQQITTMAQMPMT
jgi:hypothetical protein